ncbi:MAG: leucyl/phenylalanyl-tRNA--protein transferase [Pseudomonadota bacterium]
MFKDATPEMFLHAYAQGIFPMAESADDDILNFYSPEKRGLLPIHDLHIPKKLLKTIKSRTFKVTINKAFEDIIDACALSAKGRENTWINKTIRNVFIELHHMGHAHSVECWSDDKLAGGLYGLALGQIFCGESMVSMERDASKVALVHLCARLQKGGFKTLDTQFINKHLKQFGAYEIPQEEYEKRLSEQINKKADFILNGVSENEILSDYLTGL